MMLGKVIGAIAGNRIARDVRGVNGKGGALLGMGTAVLLRRFGPISLAAIAVGGYALKKYFEKHPTPNRAVNTNGANFPLQ